MGPLHDKTDSMNQFTKSLVLVSIFLISLSAPLLSTNVEAEDVSDIEVLHTAVNPYNNNTYHLLSEASWSESAQVALGLDGFLVTVDDQQENQWLMETFASFDNLSRHLWIGLSDYNSEGDYRWHDGTPFLYRNWGAEQPSANGEEDYVHIASTNMGNIMPGYWNDLENDPQYFPVYGVVEVGPGADYALRFDGIDDKIVIDEELPNYSEVIEISAMVNMVDTSGLNFITMMGDYGWGLYINNGNLGYSSEYSISRHPTSNITINTDEWTHVSVKIESGAYGEFFINGEPAGLIPIEDTNIPQGNFGSNDCYQSGADCDELFIGKMGAGCDCNYFTGMIDNVTISNSTESSSWQFPEGEGSLTRDLYQDRIGEIDGASWVMPDGTIVAQAVELFSDKELSGISGKEGDQLLFFIEIEPLTSSLMIDAYHEFEDFFWDEEEKFDAYFGHEFIPNSWNHDRHASMEWGFMFEQWSWPDEGTLWMVIVPKEDIENLVIYSYMEVADPPPELDEMTELINGIPVTDQTIEGGRGTPQEDRILYYYVDVAENLSTLTVKTYSGNGNVDLAISWGTVPDPFGVFFGFEEPFFEDEEMGMEMQKSAWDGGPGNEQQVTLYDVEPGIYYVAAYTYGRANDFTIAAAMTYEPENIEPEDAIELTPGVPYGPLSGYDGLLQYFKVNVPQDAERLEVDLESGFGEASLFMKLAEAPTSSDFTHSSNSPGAGDKIGFNDPTPGMWYILLETDMVFGEVKITASFEDRYVWQYDGTPIQLFNGDEISGIAAPAGESLNFFVDLEKPGDYLSISTYGGTGDLELEATGNIIDFGFDDFFDFFDEDFGESGRQRPGAEPTAEQVSINSDGVNTEQQIFINLPANGRFEITLKAIEDISEVTIIASWVYSEFIDPIEEPKNPVVTEDCRDLATKEMTSKDLDKDGLLSEQEAKNILINGDTFLFSELDINQDGEVEFAEVLQISCNCDNEIELIFNQLSPDNREVSIEILSSQVYENKYDFFETDSNSNLRISQTEIEILVLLCTTTFDAFDGDGDGVPDVDDLFPNDPDESKDSDGDGVGDNADLAPSIANDLIYSAGAIMAIGLLAMLVLVSRNSRSKDNSITWDSDKQFDLSDRMMQMEDNTSESFKQTPELPEQTMDFTHNNQPESNILELPQNNLVEDNLFEQLITDPARPPNQLLGMIDSNGNEVLEFPVGSGSKWQRTDSTQPWSKS